MSWRISLSDKVKVYATQVAVADQLSCRGLIERQLASNESLHP